MRTVRAAVEDAGADFGEEGFPIIRSLMYMDGLDLEDYLREVVTSTADNRVSMLQDLMAGRKTEIDVICGAIISKGEDLGIPTPRNQILLALVKGIEMSQNHD